MNFVDQVDVANKTLLIRVDFNVPLDEGVITDDNRIRAALPTLEYLISQNAKLVLCAHLGKPKGQVKPELTLAPVAVRLAELLGREVLLAPGCVGPDVESMVQQMRPGSVIMLENLRFHPEEQGKTAEARGDFGKQLANLADMYVSDAFGVAHRPNASVVDIPKYAQECCAGFLMRKEWEYLTKAVKTPERPYVAVSGGAKVSSKMGILKALLDKVDHLIIGGAMANTFFLAQGFETGRSLVENDGLDAAREIMALAEKKGVQLHLPVDAVYGMDINDATASGTCSVDAIPSDAMVLDIGPKSAEAFCAVLRTAKMVVWNGPMGLFENPAFAAGSLAICNCLAELESGMTLVGGGDTDAVVHQAHLAESFDFISTGGGAFLEFMEGKELPGFQALKECS